MQTNIYAEHRCQRNCRVSRLKQSGLCCACHCTARRRRRKSSGLLTTTTGIGSSDTMRDNKRGFPALTFSAQLVQDNKSKKKAMQCVRLQPDRYWLFEADNDNDIWELKRSGFPPFYLLNSFKVGKIIFSTLSDNITYCVLARMKPRTQIDIYWRSCESFLTHFSKSWHVWYLWKMLRSLYFLCESEQCTAAHCTILILLFSFLAEG